MIGRDPGSIPGRRDFIFNFLELDHAISSFSDRTNLVLINEYNTSKKCCVCRQQDLIGKSYLKAGESAAKALLEVSGNFQSGRKCLFQYWVRGMVSAFQWRTSPRRVL